MKDLLQLLEKNHAQTIDQLSTMLDKPKEEIEAQIKQLEAEKIILKYHTIIDWEKANIDKVTAIIEVKVTPQREVGFDALAERIYRFPEVRSLYLTSGSYDLLVFIEGQSLKDVGKFVSEKLSTIDGVISTTTHFMLKNYKEAGVIIDDIEKDHRLVVTP